ncbi:MAG: DUF2953 domain-containing protein [Methanobacteriaceae archaeon]|nr:DUF2953 domain-containing protein [Methanobacteriaceae archaeon]
MIYIVVIAILLIILFFIVSFLVIPLHITFEIFKSDSNIEGLFVVNWMRIKLLQRTIPSKPSKKKKKKKVEEKEKTDLKKILKIIQNFIDSLPYLSRLIRQFCTSTNIEYLKANIIIGFSSYTDTALICGYLWSLIAILKIFPNTCFNVEPDFRKEHLDISLKLKIKIKLLWIVIELIRVFMKKPVRILIKDLRSLNN